MERNRKDKKSLQVQTILPNEFSTNHSTLNIQHSTLPKGWVWVRLGEVCAVNLGKTPHKSQYVNNGRYKIIKFRDITDTGINFDENERGFVIENENVISKLSELQEKDILVTASAHSSEHIGKKVVYVSNIPKRYEKVFFVGELLCVRCRDNNIEPRTIYYYLMSQDGYKSIQNHVRGVHLIASEARQIPIPLPPLPEQHRIVAKIEELFTKLDAGVKALKKAKEQIKRYRQAVLKYAFEGKLTEEWRKENKPKETAKELLEKIKEERKKKLGEKCKARSERSRRELPPVDNSELPELPEGWAWVRLGEVCDIIMGQSPPSSTYNDKRIGLPFYQGKLEFGEMFPTPRVWCSKPKKIAENGDILLSVRAPVGPTNICNENCCIGRGLASIRYFYNNEHRFIFYFFRSIESQISKIGTGSTFSAISKSQIENISIPLPPLPEQHQIVEEIERRFSVADEVEKAIDNSLKQAERLRQSILKRAFEGKLVPQDPNDEPAEKLLERIKAEKILLIKDKKIRGRYA